MEQHHYYNPAVTVTTVDGKVTGLHIDWHDSYTETWIDGMLSEGPDDSNTASSWLDRILDEGRLPSGDVFMYTDEEVETALRFLMTLMNTATQDS
jgi:hypothetical protein